MLKVLTAAVLLVGLTTTPSPIPPVPLRYLMDEADLIAVVVADEPEILKGLERGEWRGFQVRLAVKNLVKGCVQDHALVVRYEGALLCPAPTEFIKGKTHLVFLDLLEDGSYDVTELSYGVKILDKHGVDAYLNAMKRRPEIGEIESKGDHHEAMLEWLVQLAENPYTTWEGVYDLDPDTSSKRWLEDRKWEYSLKQISAEQRERLIQALWLRERTTYADSLLATALDLTEDPRLLEISLKLALMEPEPLLEHDDDIMWLEVAVEKSSNAEAKKIFDENWTFVEEWKDWDFQGEWKDEKPVIERVVKVIRKEQ
ncbi:MAG: hypothetical protein HQ519_09100 [Planctomycetes bacterium]|nr:hypothetical protein [Planctomycetota bacterium]